MLFLIWLSLTFKWTSEVICLILIHKRRWQGGGSKFIREGSLLSRYRTIWGGGSKIAKNSRRHLWKGPYLIFVRILSSKIIFIAKDDFFQNEAKSKWTKSLKAKINNKFDLNWFSVKNLPYAHHYNLRFIYFSPHFWKSKTFFKEGFSWNSGLMYG